MQKNIWNPWHGCHRISPGCKNCYVYYQDKQYAKDSSIVTKSKSNFNLPIKKSRQGIYKIPSGMVVATCLTSDFFVEEADQWRQEAWLMIKHRTDLCFYIITKRISRFMDCIPDNWGNGWDNVSINVTAENQEMADQRLPAFVNLPIKHKGILVSPILENVNIEKYISTGSISSVYVGGESYENARECNFDWVLNIKEQCDRHNTEFIFHQTGSNFIYKGKRYKIPHKLEYSQARKAFHQPTQ